MYEIKLSLTRPEAACLYGAVSAELVELKEDLQDSSFSKDDKIEIRKSIEACTNILTKLSIANPNTTYL